MNCFPCFTSKKTKEEQEEEQQQVPVAQVRDISSTPPATVNNTQHLSAEINNNKDDPDAEAKENNGARTFTFRELAMATKNFKQECLIGEGGFGKLYKGTLQTGEVVAVKRLDRSGTQGNKEFLVEVLMLTLLHHPNLVNLIGYCADGDQRLLVYEYLQLGSLEAHLHDIPDDKQPLDWQTRMRIASGAAQGLAYLHEKANPPIMYRDLKTSNILLDEEFNPRLSDYGLAKLVQGDTKMHISPRVMGTFGYCAPEYERQGELTVKSDVYSFGVILLELITGRRALDTTRPTEDQNLVTWAQPIFREPKRFPDMADPQLKRQFPERGLNQAVGVAAMCLQEEPSVRPLIGDIVSILSFLAVAQPEESIPASVSALTPAPEVVQSNEHESDGSDNEDGDSKNHEREHTNDDREERENSDDEYDGSSASSDDDDGDHVERKNKDSTHQHQVEIKKFEKQGSSSHHKYNVEAKQGSIKFDRQDSSSKHRKKMDYNNRSISSSSRSSSKNESLNGSARHSSRNNSKSEWLDGSARHSSRRNSNAAAPQESLSVSFRQNSFEESQDGSIGSSLGQGRYEESFAWSIGSSTAYKSHSGSAHVNSGHNSEVGFHNESLGSDMRQQSSMRSKNRSDRSYSRQSSSSGSEDGNVSPRLYSDGESEHERKS